MAKHEYIAFVDLVGIKDAHAGNHNVYADKIADFQHILEDYIIELDKGQRAGIDCQVFIFSDCAFIRSTKLACLANYLRWIRYACYTSNRILFFKGAIIKGTLKAEESRIDSKSLRGVTFSRDAVTAYVRHEHSKAIGIVIDSAVHSEMSDVDCSKNFFYTSERSKTCEVFYDLSHSIVKSKKQKSNIAPNYQGISEGIARHCLHEFYKTSLRSIKQARYYPPVFCNWLQSISLKTLFVEERYNSTSSELSKEKDSPWIIFDMICNREFVRNFWQVPGVPLLFLVILNKIYTEILHIEKVEDSQRLIEPTSLPKAVREIHDFILALPRLTKFMEYASPHIFSPKCREAYLAQLIARHTRS